MEDLSLVTEVQASQELEEKELYVVWIEGTRVVLHVATEICILGGGRGRERERERAREGGERGRGRERRGERERKRERERGKGENRI